MRILLAALMLAMVACGSEPESVEVRHAGSLHGLMQGKLEARVSLDSLLANGEEFSRKRHLYALGAMENLTGEVLVLDGQVINSKQIAGDVRLDSITDTKAALLVYSYVTEWRTVDLPVEVNSMNELEDFLADYAEQNGISKEDPIPFLLEGKVEQLNWHIINWRPGMKHTHRNHQTSGAQGQLGFQDVQMLGFYSTEHKGLFTHHMRDSHIHFVDMSQRLAGHVDQFTLGKAMKLKIAVM